MRCCACIASLILSSIVCFAQATETGAINLTVVRAKRVLVTTMWGPGARPSQISLDDQKAVAAVEEELRRWKRYEITRIEQDADLIIAVRRATGAEINLAGPRVGPPPPPSVNNPRPREADNLAVYDAHGLGMESAPLWTASEPGGLAAPQLKLFRKFQKRVEEAEKRL